jgi:L-aspartate oxidase
VIDRTVVEHDTPIVVGSGIAGLTVALGLRGCTIVTRHPFGRGSSDLAQGGIAAGFGRDATDHLADTLAVSGDIGDGAVAEAVTAAAEGRIEWLIALGAEFDRNDDGSLSLGREAGHSARRIVHASGDATGGEVMRALRSSITRRDDIDRMDASVLDLALAGDHVAGVVVRDEAGNQTVHVAPAVVLATGGIGGLYARTTNPPEVAGDGIAIAARAGIELADLEFVQFHPTALDVAGDPALLLTEALRGEGALLINDRGDRFMTRIHPDAELAPRDIVARGIWAERRNGRRTFLDATGSIGASFPDRFPTVWRHARAAGLDPRVEPLPVSPAEHYHMGGIATDASGRTSAPGLWAVGEVASTGLHGANRLASNSLLEGLVIGSAAAASILSSQRDGPPAELSIPARSPQRGGDAETITEIRKMMWDHVGIVREAPSLRMAIERLTAITDVLPTARVENLALVGSLLARAALARTESRGAHYRSDHPVPDPTLAIRSRVSPEPARSIPLRPMRRTAA